MQEIDRAAQLLVAGGDRLALADPHPAEPSSVRTKASTAATTGQKTVTKKEATGAIASETRSG